MMLNKTLFNRLDKILATILKIHPTKEIGMYSLRPCGSLTFGIEAKNDGLLPFGKIPFACNSPRNLRNSSLRISQNSLMNLKLNPSRPRFLKLPHSHTTTFTSASSKGVVSMTLSD